ncbi:MAG: UxaA family hydrolase [Caldilineaceae bacterium]
MTDSYVFDEIARLPLPGDNVAIATQKLPAGVQVTLGDRSFVLPHTVLEGHRFAIAPIAAKEKLLSWNLPFGAALRNIAAGEYVVNEEMLHALSGRAIDFALPNAPNFVDHLEPYHVDEDNFVAAEQVTRHEHDRAFLGYRRPGNRGVGTRNMIVLLGASSRTGGFVKQLEERLAGVADQYANIDGIVAVAHTEGGHDDPHNLDFVLRTLAGFIVHPNVGAILSVDYGLEPVTNDLLRRYLEDNNYPLADVPHAFLSIRNGFQNAMHEAEGIVRGWLETVDATPRTPESLANLKIALQCGGSDAFSGISGNPLASWVAREVIRYGGAANLAETDELIGAEPYVLQKVRDVETAHSFLETIQRFTERAAWHGASAAGNPSGGNKFRGLYNIVLKSIGAAMKRHPDVRLDYVIPYAQPMHEPGYYFMDSPGNDLESIAGQVAAGCNIIFFVTGNGSITNFPFAPTIKIVTTTRRYQLLSRDMDVNAGKYLDGVDMDDLGAEMLDLTVNVASGQRSVGEVAGHAQVQLWRDWRQTDAGALEEIRRAPQPTGNAILLAKAQQDAPLPSISAAHPLQLVATESKRAAEQVDLILPTSLCAGQIARMMAHRFNEESLDRGRRFVALVHTEGCGVSGGPSEQLYVRTLLGYLRHPLVGRCLLLEHGCEKTHNDFVRHEIARLGLPADRFGWASIQLDGGIDAVTAKAETWFHAHAAENAALERVPADLRDLRLGIMSVGPVAAETQHAMAAVTRAIVAAGGVVVVPENSTLMSSPAYLAATAGTDPVLPTLAYGQSLHDAAGAGFHVMETPTAHWTETLTGLGATGVDAVLVHVGEHPIQGHPLLPVIQITADERVEQHYAADMDLVLGGGAEMWPQAILDLVADVLSQRRAVKANQVGNIDFQFTRGLLGVSL